MKRPTKPSHEPTIAELQELRERAWQRLRAAVPIAIEAMAQRKARLESRIDAGKKLSSRDQRELDEIRALLGRIERARAREFLNRVGPETIQAALRQIATDTGGARR